MENPALKHSLIHSGTVNHFLTVPTENFLHSKEAVHTCSLLVGSPTSEKSQQKGTGDQYLYSPLWLHMPSLHNLSFKTCLKCETVLEKRHFGQVNY